MAKIRFDLPVESGVKLIVYDFQGRKVTTLVNKRLPEGSHVATWNATGLTGGMSFYRLYFQSGDAGRWDRFNSKKCFC